MYWVPIIGTYLRMQSATSNTAEPLLGRKDPAPAEVVNGQSDSDCVLVCEHAGRAIPASLGTLGLGPEHLALHIAYDIGAAAVARAIAQAINAPLVLQPYCRLVVDCNRPVGSAEAIPEISDGIDIPGNRDLSLSQRQKRFGEIFEPFHRTVSDVIDRHPRMLVIAIHTFTPVLNGKARPWDVGFLFRKDSATSHHLAATIRQIEPDLKIGMNEPYAIEDGSDWFVPHHGERRGIAHSLVEIRNDHLGTRLGCERFADLFCQAIGRFLEQQKS